MFYIKLFCTWWQHFIALLHVAYRDRNTDNLLLASAIVAIFTEMNSLDQ